MSAERLHYQDQLPAIPESFRVKDVILAGDRGPCGGVIRAINATQEILDHTKRIKDATGIEIPVYASHQVVHHGPISNEFASQGLIIEPNPEKVEPGSIYFLSAHGTKPSVVDALKDSGVIVGNLECQLVYADRVRAQATIRDGKELVYFGSPNHPEVEAVTGDLDKRLVRVIDSRLTADEIELPSRPFDVLSQTTISRERVRKTVERWGQLHSVEVPVFEKGPCPATDYRQTALDEALDNQDSPVDLTIIVTSKESHNGKELVGIGKKAHKGSVAVDLIENLDTSIFTEDVSRVAISSAASVLDRFTVPFLQWFQKGGAHIRLGTEREEYRSFPPPKDLEVIHQYLREKYEVS
jgi:4-hydroxy-3-methylbut-2-enyl diphosphate reductase